MKPQEDGRFKSRTFSRSLEKELVLSSEGIGDKRSIGVERQTRGEGNSKPHSQISLAPLQSREGHCLFREECLKLECPRNWITPKQLWKYASIRCVRRQLHIQSQIKGSRRNLGKSLWNGKRARIKKVISNFYLFRFFSEVNLECLWKILCYKNRHNLVFMTIFTLSPTLRI